MTTVKNFCAGCNQLFDSTAAGSCPKCGMEAVPVDQSSTLDLGELPLRETQVGSPTPEHQKTDSLIGTELGYYRLDDLLGRGGMARVYRSTHLLLERPCALKVFNPLLVQQNPNYVELFFNEARAAAALTHSNVVTVHNVGRVDKYHFIEMEFVEGRSLQAFLDETRRVGPVRAVQLMLQIGAALSAAHAMGLVHRDLKPSNVLISSDGTAKLADFGLAKTVVSSQASSRLTTHGLVGTPYYMAPELFEGQPADKRSDVYAAGVTLFYLVTGQPPFLSRSISELSEKHRNQIPPPLREFSPEAPSGIDRIVQRCLAKEPTGRYPDAGALFEDLKAIYGGLRDMESLITEAVRGLSVEWKGTRGAFDIVVQLEDGRSQQVFIESSMATPISDRVVKIFSISAPVKEDYLRRALELNAKIPHASIAIQEIGGKPHFVVVNTYPRSSCDPEEIRRSILSVSSLADQIEALLTSTDRH